jgi:acetyl esterase/lipase
VLEKAAQDFADETNRPPYLFQLPPERGRQIVDEAQSDPAVAKSLVNEEWIQVHGGPTGAVPVRIVKPADAVGALPVILHLHGGGWVYSGAHTHDRLVREVANRSHAAVVFPEYDHAPEARYPTAIEQCYAVAQWVVRDGAEKHLDASRFVLVGDSVGGTMAIALALMAKQRGDVRFSGQVLFYPPTDAGFDTDSYHHFAEGYFVRRDAMKWYWDQYTTDPDERAQITASPLRATLDQLRGLPPTMLITAEADVLRDEGEAFAARLREAGVSVTAVRFGGIIHDFALIDAMRDTAAARACMDLATSFLRRLLGTARWPLDGC